MRLFLISVMTGLLIFPLMAQNSPRLPNVGKQMERLVGHLELDAVQSEQVEEILRENRARMEALFDDEKMNKRARFRAISQLRQEKDQKILALLNDKQKKTYKEMMEQRKREEPRTKRGKGKGMGRRGMH